jgi:signal transduction histidine kinase
MNLMSFCTQLQQDPDSLPWSEKVAAAASLTEGLGWKDKLPPQSAVVLGILAADSKWEVRKAVADVLHLVPESHFSELAAQLGADSHHFVRTSAQKALDRRSKAQVSRRRHGRGLKKAESEIERIAIAHGDEVATAVRDQAVRFFEGLVGGSVHELRAILTALRGDMDSLVQEITQGRAEHGTSKFVPRLRETMQFMEHLLEDMRSYTEFPQEQRHTEIVADLVQSALHMVQAGFADARKPLDGIHLSVDIPLDMTLPAARKPLVMALRNFIKNAHEAILEDDSRNGVGTIRISARRAGDHHEICIVDDGMGLDENELANVRKFIPGNSSKNNGTGYGLPIAQRYVTFHGGTLEIQSQDGKGTTVVVRLPAEIPE